MTLEDTPEGGTMIASGPRFHLQCRDVSPTVLPGAIELLKRPTDAHQAVLLKTAFGEAEVIVNVYETRVELRIRPAVLAEGFADLMEISLARGEALALALALKDAVMEYSD